MKYKHNPRMQQKTERRIGAALRLLLVALMLAVQVGLVFLCSILLANSAAFIYTLLEIVGLIAACVVYSRPGGGSYNFSWVLIILTVPVAGLLLYLLWGANTKKKLSLKKLPRLCEDEQHTIRAEEQLRSLQEAMPQWGTMANKLYRQNFLLYTNTAVTYFPTGEGVLEDMLDRMAMARKYIIMEYYIMARGELWDRITHIFRRKCAEGVEVMVIFDDFGSMMRFGAEEVNELRQMGVKVQVFNPVHQYVNRLYFNYRNHRKITCIDGEITYTGGVNIADEYANIIERFGHWKDCGVRMEGEGAWGLGREALYMWLRMGGTLDRAWDDYRGSLSCRADGWFQAVVDGPDNNPQSPAEDAFLQMIQRARQSVYIMTPYLAIDDTMMRSLCMAGDAGLDVHLCMPGIPDHKFAYTMAKDYFGQLMSHGVHIHTYTPGLLHAKTVLIDNEVAFVGSVNMDYRSFVLHFECGMVFYQSSLATALRKDFDDLIEKSHEYTPEDDRRRPLLKKLSAKVLRWFANLM